MSDFWSRVRKGRLFQVLVVYLGASWVILQVADALEDTLSLPEWVGGAAFLLLLAGLVVIVATAWIQSHPLVDARARAEEVPHAWELDAGDLRAALRERRLPHLTWARALAGGGIVFLLLFGFAGLFVVIEDRGRSFLPEPLEAAALPGLAVMPFEVRGEGLDVWREGMVDLLSTNLDGIAGLRGIDSRTVLARWRERVGDGRPDLPAVLDAARATGGRLALVGSAVRLGPQVRLSGDLYDLESGRSLGSARAEGPADSVLALVDRFSVDLVRVVLENGGFSPSAAGLRDVASLGTSSLAAVQAYLEGEASFRSGDFEGAIDALERALAADSAFALPLARLAAAYGWAEGIGSAHRREYGERAAAHVSRLPPREAAVVRATNQARSGDAGGVAALERLTQRYPDDAEIWYELGDSYVHSATARLVPQTEARRAFDRAIALDSSFAPAYIHPFEMSLGRQDTVRAGRYLEAYRRHAPPGSTYREGMEVAYRMTTRPDSTAAILGSLPTEAVGAVAGRLRHQLGAAAAIEALARSALQRPTPPPGISRIGIQAELVGALVSQGRIREAVEESQELPPVLRAIVLYPLAWFGVPIEPAALQEIMESVVNSPVRAVAAVDLGRWEEAAALARTVRDSAAASIERGDTIAGSTSHAFADALDAYAVWRRDGPANAIEPMREAFERLPLHDNSSPSWPIRVWLALMLTELDRPAEALRYFASLEHDHVFALLRSAEAHEALGQREEALEDYALVHNLWQNADPDLPHVASVRRALERLTSETE